MRTLVLLLAASTLAVASPSAAERGNVATPQISLVETSTHPRPGGGQFVHYAILQRVQPLLTASPAGPGATGTTIVSADAVGLTYDKVPDGWVSLGTLTVVQYAPHAAGVASVGSTASSTLGEAATPAPLTLAIAPVRPNPAHGRALVVDVALPGSDAGRLELMDVMGRRVAMRDLGSLGAGRHSIDLSGGERFAPGVYLLRLTQGRDSRVERVTVVD